MVVDSDTIVDPWTVMIKSFNTLVASVAMSRSWGSYYKAVWAKLDWVNKLHQFLFYKNFD